MGLPALIPPGSQGKPGILVVDDELDVLESAKSVIAADLRDIPAWFADDPWDAAEIAQKERLGLLITDFKMPGMTGIELIEQLRRRMPNLPAMLVTGYNDPAILGPRIEALRVPVLAKPYDIGSFVALARRLYTGGLPAVKA